MHRAQQTFPSHIPRFLEIGQEVTALHMKASERFRLNLGHYLRHSPENSHPMCDRYVFLILQVALRLVIVYDKNLYENSATGSPDRAEKFFRFHIKCPHLFAESRKTYICVCVCARPAGPIPHMNVH